MEVNSIKKEIVDSIDELNLASRWDRFWASLIDGLILTVVIFFLLYITVGLDGLTSSATFSMKYTLLMGALSVSVFALINFKPLVENGQTIGKLALGIKIVTLSGESPTVGTHLLKRYGIYLLIGYLPFIGQILYFVNLLIIFGKQKRCGHDFVAGTKVVKI